MVDMHCLSGRSSSCIYQLFPCYFLSLEKEKETYRLYPRKSFMPSWISFLFVLVIIIIVPRSIPAPIIIDHQSGNVPERVFKECQKVVNDNNKEGKKNRIEDFRSFPLLLFNLGKSIIYLFILRKRFFCSLK